MGRFVSRFLRAAFTYESGWVPAVPFISACICGFLSWALEVMAVQIGRPNPDYGWDAAYHAYGEVYFVPQYVAKSIDGLSSLSHYCILLTFLLMAARWLLSHLGKVEIKSGRAKNE